MAILTILFWVSLAVLFYCYVGYAMLIFLLNLFRKDKKPVAGHDARVPVTLIVTAYNEEAVLPQKIRNTLQIDYPPGLLQIIFITDGSTDRSADLVREHSGLLALHLDERKGKYAAIKRAMLRAQHPIVVFSDANTMLNSECIKKMVDHYQDNKVGGVAGEKKISRGGKISAVGAAEGLYWKYESLLKKLDARFNTVTGAAGELFSIRRSLFKELGDEVVLDDFVMSMQICLQGYRIAYEPQAFAVELASATLSEEEKRKTRISAGAYQSVGYLKECLNIFKYPVLAFQYISRRLLRWVFCPVLLVLVLAINILLYMRGAGEPYNWLLYAQLLLYVMAFAGWKLALTGRPPGILTIPFYFLFMNYCLAKGFARFIQGKQSVLWEKSLRQAVE